MSAAVPGSSNDTLVTEKILKSIPEWLDKMLHVGQKITPNLPQGPNRNFTTSARDISPTQNYSKLQTIEVVHEWVDPEQFNPEYHLQVTDSQEKYPKRVLLMAYMRGGSSFLGQMFARNPDALFWFEVVDPMYGAMMGLRIYNNAYEVTHLINGSRRSVRSNLLSMYRLCTVNSKSFSCKFLLRIKWNSY